MSTIDHDSVTRASMKLGVNFTPSEEKEYHDIISIKPKGFGQHLSVFFDRVMNSIWTFVILVSYSLLGLFFPQMLTPLLFWSNAYQLSSLPIVAIAATLGTARLMRLVFRIYLNQRVEAQQHEKEAKRRDALRAAEIAELKQMHLEQRKMITELTQVNDDIQVLLKKLITNNVWQERVDDRGDDHI